MGESDTAGDGRGLGRVGDGFDIRDNFAESVHEFVPTADDLDPDAQYILDGTLLPCWSWAGHKDLYSRKRKTTGMNFQVACTIYGKLAWISDPVDGSRHGDYCQE